MNYKIFIHVKEFLSQITVDLPPLPEDPQTLLNLLL